MRKWAKDHSLSLVLLGLFLVSWVIQTWTGWNEFRAEQQEHGQAAHWLGEGGYLWTWAAATMENWQSEFLQLLTFVVLTAHLIHKGSHESKDTDDDMKAQLNRMEREIRALNRQRRPRRNDQVPA